MVFAGYGISAPALHYDDYAGIDATGKAVLIFTHEPQENDPRSAFEGQTNTVHSTMMRKVEVARKNGAKAILVVDDTNHRPSPDRFRRWLREPQAEDYGIPVFFLSRDLVQRALGTRLNLETTSDEIDRDFSPKSRALADLTVSALDRTTRVRRPVRNVIGILKGSDPALQSEVVIVGAHYDHLGRSGRFSMSQNTTGQVHHGADDNASGTAAVIEMAKAAVEARKEFRRSIVFMTFAGEEHGLLGSSYYVNHPTLPLDKTIAMINLDMVGRAGGRIMVDGLANSPSIDDDLKAAESCKLAQASCAARRTGRRGERRRDVPAQEDSVDQFLLRLPFGLSPAERHVGQDRRRGRRGRGRSCPRACATAREPRGASAVRRHGAAGAGSARERQRRRRVGLRPVFRIGARFRK